MTSDDTKAAEFETQSGMIQLIMPNPHGADPEHRENPLANLDFGPAGKHADDHSTTNITFREVEPGVGRAVIRGDHPLLKRLIEKYPQVRVGEELNPTVYLCAECDDGREFGSKIGLRSHMRVHQSKE
jgi:hypothetical protein